MKNTQLNTTVQPSTGLERFSTGKVLKLVRCKKHFNLNKTSPDTFNFPLIVWWRLVSFYKILCRWTWSFNLNEISSFQNSCLTKLPFPSWRIKNNFAKFQMPIRIIFIRSFIRRLRVQILLRNESIVSLRYN